MDQQLIQRTRYVLRSRFRYAQTCPDALFPSACKHLLLWLESHPIISKLLIHLNGSYIKESYYFTKVTEAVKLNQDLAEFCNYSADSTIEHAAICSYAVKAISEFPKESRDSIKYGIDLVGSYFGGHISYKTEENLKTIRDVAIDGLFEFIDEQLDSRNAIYGILIKYKQRTEWFRRKRIQDITFMGLENKTGEKALIVDLQEYILDQGVEFTIEPSSASGEVDLILKATEDRYIVIDAKYIKEDSTRSEIVSKITSGFHQVMRYCNDYNEPEGFLVSFVCARKRINLMLNEKDGLPFLNLGGKTIYHIFINIADEPSASKSGKAEQFDITQEELIQISLN